MRETIIERIKSNIIVEGECWVWQGGNSGEGKGAGRGYGRISIRGYTSSVHRVMYICEYGYIPNKIQVDHLCNNRLCCNPKHLEAVTHKQNCRRRDKNNAK